MLSGNKPQTNSRLEYKKQTLIDTNSNSNSIRHRYPKYTTRAEHPFTLTYIN